MSQLVSSRSLNIGCGDFYAPGWLNIDLHDNFEGGPRPDVVASALDLPFDDDSFDRVYCGHVLEHLAPREEVPGALAEIRRVLAPGGVLTVVGPDIDLARDFEPEVAVAIIGGASRWKGDGHAWVATGRRTRGMLMRAGFEVRELTIADVSDEWPVVSRIGWQFALECH